MLLLGVYVLASVESIRYPGKQRTRLDFLGHEIGGIGIIGGVGDLIQEECGSETDIWFILFSQSHVSVQVKY